MYLFSEAFNQRLLKTSSITSSSDLSMIRYLALSRLLYEYHKLSDKENPWANFFFMA
jgi:hypothetical protein